MVCAYIHQKYLLSITVFAGGSVAKDMPPMQEMQVLSLDHKDSPGEGNGNPLQYFCLGNPMDKGAWWATVHGVEKESDSTLCLKQLFSKS